MKSSTSKKEIYEVETTPDGSRIHRRVAIVADALRPVAALAQEWGIASPTLLSLARRRGILRRLGRQNVVRVSEILDALNHEPAIEAPPSGPRAVDDLDATLRAIGARK